MNGLDAQDFAILGLALDLLSRYTNCELLKARRARNNAKQEAMIAMRTQIVTVRRKLRAMQLAT